MRKPRHRDINKIAYWYRAINYGTGIGTEAD